MLVSYLSRWLRPLYIDNAQEITVNKIRQPNKLAIYPEAGVSHPLQTLIHQLFVI